MSNPANNLSVVLILLIATLAPARAARASELNLPPEAVEGMRLMYSGQPNRAIQDFRALQQQRPEDPLGYLLEAEALWWKMYCASLDRKYNTIDVWSRPRAPGDDAYFVLTDKAARLADAAIARSDSAEMELYAGLAFGMRARLTGLRGERFATARSGVEGRKRLLRCLELDPNMTDADTGLGLYNYLVDTLSAPAKFLRFFMGIPGGSKTDGLRQLKTAARSGELTSVEARFYLARDLRNYDRDYFQALDVATQLQADYPENPIFVLLAGDIEAKLGHNEAAAADFRAAAALSAEDPACAARVQTIAAQAIAALSAHAK